MPAPAARLMSQAACCPCLAVAAQYTGEMGVLAIFPLVAFFGFGVLSKDDFNGFLWCV